MSRIIISIFAIILLSTPAMADQKIRVLTEDFAPFNYPDNGEIVGISTIIVKAAFERAGVAYSLESVPWMRGVEELETIPNTFLYTMARTVKREGKYIWVGKLFNRKVSLFRHKGRTDLDKLSTAELRYNTRPCAVKGDASYELLLQLGFNKSSIFTPSSRGTNICPNMVQNGRADFTAYNPYALAYKVKLNQLDDVFTAHSELVNEDGYYLAAHPDSDPKLIEKLQQAFKELADEGFNDKIAAEYIGY
ncbi:MAG: transporter substrate-binding domain-containing protein [Pseudodesulfovibrio sp.]